MSLTIEEKNKIFKILRDLKNKNCPSDVNIINTCTNPIPVYFCDPTQEYDKEILCAPDGTRIVVVTTYSSTGIPSSIAYNLDGTIYSGTISELRTCDIDLESDPIIICINGITAYQWVVKKDGEPTGDVYYTNKFGALIGIPVDFTLGECSLCDPKQESFIGNNSTLTEFNSIAIFIPKCCTITYMTSAGTVTIPSQSNPWMYSQSFECNVTGYNISASCDINNITTTLTKTK